jgi:hypothetical protein
MKGGEPIARETHTYVERDSPTYVERDSSAMGIFAVLLAVVLIVFLFWAIFFSGWVVDRGGQEEAPLIEQREETEINVPGGGGAISPRRQPRQALRNNPTYN